ncbi:MAG: phage tail sheath protein, partial [Oscillibacter sp.]
MSTLTMPSVNVAFKEAAATAVARSQKGVAALIVRDAALADKGFTLQSTNQIPAALGAENQAAVRRVFLGYVNPPKTVLL